MTVRTILIVEDNPITRKMLRSALDTDGYRLLEAPDGASALAHLADGDPDLVVLDLNLPDIDGFDLVKLLRAHPRGAGIPILACSAGYGSFDDLRLRGADFDEILPKPIDPSTLLQVIRGYLKTRTIPASAFGSGMRALVVDDDPIQLKLLAHRLFEVGFETISAVDGQDALEQAKHHKPDCIVSDVMMPRLDGFGLCQAIRIDRELSQTLVILATNSYVEKADRDLASKIGADELVIRTPELDEILEALKLRIENRAQPRAITRPPEGEDMELERERNQRMLSQLEKQVGLNARQAQRSATLAMELAVVNGISSALVNGHDVGTAMDTVLAACLDAGGVSLGALYLFDGDTCVNSHMFGGPPGLTDFFGRLDVIRQIIRETKTVHLNRAELDRYELPDALGSSALVVPVLHRGKPHGALLLASNHARTDETERIAFAETVANQLALAFMLAKSFELRQQSEADAKRQANLLASILDAVTDGVAAVGCDGQFTRWNRAATSILGIGAPGSTADAWAEYYGFYDADGAALVACQDLPLIRALRGDNVDSAEFTVRRANLPAAAVSVNARPLRDERGEIAGSVAVFRDVTDQKKAQAQLMVSDRMASVGLLAAGVAHEINNPLAALLANLDIIDEDLRAHVQDVGTASPRIQDIREALSEARLASDRVRLIVKDLKIFSRAEEDTRGAVDIERVIESSLRMAWNEIRHRAQLVKQFASVPTVNANEARLGQVFLNLIVNAAQAIPEGHAETNQIVITTCLEDGWVVTKVRDTGPGMPPEVVAKLFTPFFTTKPSGLGTGLGLVICERIIHGLGGRITADSKVGDGTVITVSLRPHVEVEPSKDLAARAVHKRTKRGSVLLVDDDSALGKTVRRALEREHDVLVLEDAREALQRIEAGSTYDVILCDLMMPLMTGVEFFRALEQLRPSLLERVVFLTGGAFTPGSRAFLDEVTNARMEKPFEVANLRSLVNDRVR